MKVPIIIDNKYVTYTERPVYEKDYRVISNDFNSVPSVAIIMQGPLKLEKSFTYETLKLYKKTFPNCELILSTWKTEAKEEILKIKSIGVHVILNDEPQIASIFHTNHNICSSKTGIAYARKLGLSYVMKTRTDQRFYETNIIQFLFNMLKVFPCNDVKVQTERLIALSFDTFKYRLYGISDMFLFGHIDDVEKFYNSPLEERTEVPKLSSNTQLDYAKQKFAEIFLTTEYLKKIGHKINWTLKDSWNCYGKYFCIVDASSLGFYWPKYSNIENRWRNFFSLSGGAEEELTFKEWLNCCYNLNSIIVPEHLISSNDYWNKPSLRFSETIEIKKNKIKSMYNFIIKILKKTKKYLGNIYRTPKKFFRFIFPVGRAKELKKIILQEKKEKKTILKQYKNKAGKNTAKKTVIAMFDGKIAQGGLCDRLRGVVSIYQTCKKLGLDFKLNFVFPFNLTDFIEPNTYDWKIDSKELNFDKKSLPFFLFSKKDDKIHAEKQIKKIEKLLQKNYNQFHIYSNAHYSLFSETYTQDFNELFKPTKRIKQELDSYLGEHKEYISVSFRFMQLLGDFDEKYKSIYTVLPEDKKIELINKSLKMLKKIHEKENLPIFVATDSKTMLNEASKLHFVFVISGEISHVDATNKDTFEANKKTFIDFYMIANAKKVYCAHSTGMLYSGFPKNAALSSGKEFNILEY